MSKIRVVGIDIAKSVFKYVSGWLMAPLPGTGKYRVKNYWILSVSLNQVR